METASASDLEVASAQGTILAIEYGGIWYGNGTVGDVQSYEEVSTSEVEDDGYGAVSEVNDDGYGAVSEVDDDGYGTVSEVDDDGYGAVVDYSFVGVISLLIFGAGLFGFRRATGRRRVALAAGEGTTPSTTSPPLV